MPSELAAASAQESPAVNEAEGMAFVEQVRFTLFPNRPHIRYEIDGDETTSTTASELEENHSWRSSPRVIAIFRSEICARQLTLCGTLSKATPHGKIVLKIADAAGRL